MHGEHRFLHSIVILWTREAEDEKVTNYELRPSQQGFYLKIVCTYFVVVIFLLGVDMEFELGPLDGTDQISSNDGQ